MRVRDLCKSIARCELKVIVCALMDARFVHHTSLQFAIREVIVTSTSCPYYVDWVGS